MYAFSIALFLTPIVATALFATAFAIVGRLGHDVPHTLWRQRAPKPVAIAPAAFVADFAARGEDTAPAPYPYAVRPIGTAKPAPVATPYPYVQRPINARRAA